MVECVDLAQLAGWPLNAKCQSMKSRLESFKGGNQNDQGITVKKYLMTVIKKKKERKRKRDWQGDIKEPDKYLEH